MNTLKTALIAVVSTITLSTQAQTSWVPVSVVKDNSRVMTWSVREGSVGLVGDAIFGVVEAKSDSESDPGQIFNISVSKSQCRANLADISMFDIRTGKLLSATVLNRGVNSPATNISNYFCLVAARRS